MPKKQNKKDGMPRRTKGSGTTRPASSPAILASARPETAGSRINPKWAWHYRVLLRLREQLLKDRGEERATSSEQLERHSINPADSATDEFDHNLALRQFAHNQDALYEVDDAIRRIVSGNYGVCEVSGKRIPSPRLKAIPWTRFTCEVEAQLERNGVVGPARIGELHSVRSAKERQTRTGPEEWETSKKRMKMLKGCQNQTKGREVYSNVSYLAAAAFLQSRTLSGTA